MKKRSTGIVAAALIGIGLAVLVVWKSGAIDLKADERRSVKITHEEAAGKKDAPGDEHGHELGVKQEEENLIRLTEEEMKQFGIEVAEVRPGKLGMDLSLSGEIIVNADRMAHIVPRLSGLVREVRKSVGDSVRQGELMAVIESRELADAKAEYLASAEKVALQQAKFSREERLWKKKISAEQDYLDARQSLAETRIMLRSAEQKLHALGFSDAYLKDLPRQHDMSYTRYEIIAPFSGTVIERHITLGEVLKEDAEAFLIADLGTVWVNLNVHQRDLPMLRKGQMVVISAGHNIPDTRGEISFVNPLIKEVTRTAMARVILPNTNGNWRPGMFVTARAIVDEVTVPVLVPKEAVQTVDGETVVFVQTPEGFVPKSVTIGRANETDVEVTSGLSPGERCVARGTFTLKAQLSKGAFGDGHAH